MSGVLFGAVGVTGAFMEGSGALQKSEKMKMVKNCPYFKMNALVNYIPKYRLLFFLLKLIKVYFNLIISL